MKTKILAILLTLLPSVILADTMIIECKYTEFAQPDGLHKTKEDFVLQFLIDKNTGKSYILGNNGSAEVIRMGSEDQITFVEITGVKNVMTTTMAFDNGKSVHSRNTVSFGDLIPSQYYGSCVDKL